MMATTFLQTSRGAMARLSLAIAAAVLAAACSSSSNGGDTGGGGTGGGSGGSGGGGTIKPVCLTGSDLDCSAKEQVQTADGKSVNNNGQVFFNAGSLAQGQEDFLQVIVKNAASTISAAGLTINAANFEYTAGSPEETAEDAALACFGPDKATPCSQMAGKWKTLIPSGVSAKAGQGTSETIWLKYKRFDGKVRNGVLTLKLGGFTAPKDFVIKVGTKLGQPKASFSPEQAAFPYTAPGKCESQDVVLVNNGDALLTLTGLDMANLNEQFSLTLTNPADFDTEEHQGGKPWTFPDGKILEIKPGASATFSLKFCPKDDKKKQGQVRILGNDPTAPPLGVLANSAVPCIQFKPAGEYNFGGHVPGSEPGALAVAIVNCGSVELEVTGLDFVADETNSNEFTISVDKLASEGKLPAAGPISPENPLKIGVSKSEEFEVFYAPSDITIGETNYDIGVITAQSNAYVNPKLKVKGIGVETTCPIAKVTVAEGEEVVPQTELHLNGSKSIAPGGGTIKKYKWTVKQPSGSNKPLNPSATFANPTLKADAAGEYEFCLDVWDQNDVKSCVPACVTVLVIPNNAIHVELLWDTPADPDQTDSGPAAGADLDLHYAHPLASTLDLDCDGVGDPWFANPWDTFWFNATPQWGSAAPGVNDDPTLDLDDTDGAGPENLNLVEPEGTIDDPISYAVGVHYWNDHGYGTSYGTVSIYIQGGLALQFTKVKLDPLDMWYVGKINWPNTATGGLKKVFDTCYQSGDSCKAGKSLMWQPKGDWCITKCYKNVAFEGTVGGGAASGACKK